MYILNSTELKCRPTQNIKLYHFVHTILSVPFCPIPFCPYTILSIPFCPYHFVRYHFVRSPNRTAINQFKMYCFCYSCSISCPFLHRTSEIRLATSRPPLPLHPLHPTQKPTNPLLVPILRILPLLAVIHHPLEHIRHKVEPIHRHKVVRIHRLDLEAIRLILLQVDIRSTLRPSSMTSQVKHTEEEEDMERPQDNRNRFQRLQLLFRPEEIVPSAT